MKNRILLVMLSISALTAAEAQRPELARVAFMFGRWEGLPTSTVGIGHVMEFTQNGIAMCTAGALVEGTYRVAGQDLIQSAATPPDTVKVRIAFRGDTMVQWSADHLDSARFMRRSGTPSNTVVGVWRSRSPTGRETFLDYRPDGTFKLWVPYETKPGTFSVKGDTITIMIEGGKMNGKYVLAQEGAKLRFLPLEDKDAKPIILSREER